MDFFNYFDDNLYVEQVAVKTIAQANQGPCYIYSQSAIEHNIQAFKSAFGKRKHRVCYAVKANSHLAILKLMVDADFGFDIVSVGELYRVIKAGGDPAKIVFSGVGKQDFEIAQSLQAGIGCFNVESISELKLISKIANKLNILAPISMRVNPDIDAMTHHYISTGMKENKFGVQIEDIVEIYQYAQSLPNLKIIGIDCHIGSQITQIKPYIDSVKRLIIAIQKLYDKGIQLKHVDIGGGMGVRYVAETPMDPAILLNQVYKEFAPLFARIGELEIIIEPGRAIIANAGILVSKVLFIKSNAIKNFAIVDAGMNDLIRPSIYQAYMDIIEVEKKKGASNIYDVVGPVCETGDFLGKERSLIIEQNDYLAVRGAGAYGASMASNYNTRPRIAEYMVKGDKTKLITRPQTIEEIYQYEIF